MDAKSAISPSARSSSDFPYHVISPTEEPYSARVVETYADSPADWQKILGERMWYQFGEYPKSGESVSLAEAGRLYLEHQLTIAGYGSDTDNQPERILDVGCGWGEPLVYMAERFDRCQRLDGVNISPQQMQYAYQAIQQGGVSDRAMLYLCNAQDIDRLPDSCRDYTLVIFRGSITHFPYSVLERAISHARQLIDARGKLLIADNLYNVPLSTYRSPVPDDNDRIACGYRKTPEYMREVLETSGFRVDDIRVLPSQQDTVRWLNEVHQNIESYFGADRPPAIDDLYVTCDNLMLAVKQNLYSVYSIIASPC